MEGDHVLIRVGFMDAYKFCDVGLKNLTKASFIRDGNLRSNIRATLWLDSLHFYF